MTSILSSLFEFHRLKNQTKVRAEQNRLHTVGGHSLYPPTNERTVHVRIKTTHSLTIQTQNENKFNHKLKKEEKEGGRD